MMDLLSDGAIGSWTVGIGDPTVGGWLTVGLYLTAVGASWYVLRAGDGLPRPLQANEQWVWRALTAMLLVLGINKQLDLQSALTEIGRYVANHQGWYSERGRVQVAFIAGIAVIGATLLTALLYLASGAPFPTLWAIGGGVCLAVFVVIRAASFHRVDTWLAESLVGFRFNWLLEMGGLMVVIGSVWCRRRVR